MTTRTQVRPWDLSHVLELVNTLSSPKQQRDAYFEDGTGHTAPAVQPVEAARDHDNTVDTRDFALKASGLGDFAKVWQYLGTPLHSPAPMTSRSNEDKGSLSILPSKVDYASDGATFYKAPSGHGKAVQWQEIGSAEEPTTDAVTDRSASPDSPTLTKSQRKKNNRRARRAKEAATMAAKSATVSESEADSVSRRTPARKASAHIGDTARKHNLRPRDAFGRALTASPSNAQNRGPKEPNVANNLVPRKTPATQASVALAKAPTTPQPRRPSVSIRQQSHPASTTAKQQSAYDALHNRPVQQWPVPAPSQAFATQFLPSTVQPPLHSAANPSPSQLSSVQQAVQAVQAVSQSQNVAPKTPAKKQLVIEPKVVRSGEDRNWALVMKLIGDFWEDRKYIISPMNLTTHNNDPKGIHVFVDASNIFIGFNDQLKRARNIPQHFHVPPVNLSFDALALLMERRRPVAKRVLAGSTPRLPAFDKAEAVGYECSLLEKVYKARELTERQIYFKERDEAYRQSRKGAKAPAVKNSAVATNGAHHRSGSGSGSGSETTAPQYAPAKMIEQGVDEILHLKILESIVDTDEPSTMVLATGDAAQAEYSKGFMAMAERALKKGWRVELVSWSKNISMMYTKKDWIDRWGAMFRIIYLDDYAEELLDM